MNKRQTKRINFSLYLSPNESQADLRTVTTLQQWHDGLKQDTHHRDDVAMEIRAFHRNVYLAGLQLHLLNPQLCCHVAESIGRQSLTLTELLAELARCELLPVGVPESVSGTGEFSGQQLKQLRLLLGQTIPELLPTLAVQESNKHTDQQTEFTRLHGELERIRTLLEQQTSTPQPPHRSKPVVTTGGSKMEEMSVSKVAAPAEKIKQIRQKGIF